MGLSGGQYGLPVPLLLLLTCLPRGTALEHISYVPQLSNRSLAGTLTQSTFTLEQPRGQFSHRSISDSDVIWLVVAHSNATQNFSAPQRVEDIPVPEDFTRRGYYLTLMANRLLYPGNQPGNQLRVLRVGNDTSCSPTKRGCNHPLPGPGPYRVKFLVMSDKGPVAETEWSNETHLQRGKGLVKHWGGGVWGPGAPEDGLGWGDGASPPSQAPLPPHCLPVPLPELGRGMVSLEASQVPLLRSDLSSFHCSACLGKPPHAPQLRGCRLLQAPKARAPWSSLPFCRSCWLSSSLPSLLCLSTPGKWTGSGPPGRGGVSDRDHLLCPQKTAGRASVCAQETLLRYPSGPANCWQELLGAGRVCALGAGPM
uniref:Uroplakin 3B n=1 Tax=Canis lupus familiaris TaxID=9615 RepID=A0A8C0QFP2_CANLF